MKPHILSHIDDEHICVLISDLKNTSSSIAYVLNQHISYRWSHTYGLSHIDNEHEWGHIDNYAFKQTKQI